jgi:hypothetical protein
VSELKKVVGRGGLEPPTSAVGKTQRCSSESYHGWSQTTLSPELGCVIRQVALIRSAGRYQAWTQAGNSVRREPAAFAPGRAHCPARPPPEGSDFREVRGR